jgi:hypothetical protein
MQDLFGCNSKPDCDHSLVTSCKSNSDFLTAVCDLTADEIKTKVADWLQNKACADDGVMFSPPVRPVQTTPAPAVIAVPVESPKAPADTKHFVMLTVTLPYTKADFDQAKQEKYKAAMAATAGTSVANVVIEMITEKRRRAGSVDVKTKVT